MKRKAKIGLVVLSATLLVTSCSKVSANLSNPDDPIVVDQSGATIEVENNTINTIFNTIKNGDSYASSVSDMLSEAIANAYIGTYKVNRDGNVYIEELGENPSDSQILEFVQNHKFYWNWESTSNSVQYEEETSSANISDYKNRINNYIELVQKEIVKTIYDEAVVATYQKNNRFYESLYAKSIYEKMYKIYDANGQTIDPSLLYSTPDYKNGENRSEFESAGFTFGKLVTRDYNPDEDYRAIIEGDTQLLHLYHYVDYINNSIIPDIMSKLLTQSYIFERQYQSIGRTQARHLNFIKLTNNSSNKAEQMMTEFVDRFLSKETESNVDFTPLIEAWIGDHNQLNSDESTLDPETKAQAKELADAVFGEEQTTLDSEYQTYIDGKTGADYPHYQGSLYGDIIDDYSYLTNNPYTNDTSLYDGFVEIDGIPYTPEEGLNSKIENLSTTSYITNAWGDSGSFDVGSTDIVNNLFSYGLSSEFTTAKNANTNFAMDGYFLKQFTVGGPTFLKKIPYSNPIDSVIWNNESDYYIIEVVDQVSLSSLAIGPETTSEEKAQIEDYAREIGYIVASDTTYTNNALVYYLEQSNINYYDQDVYDYFETTYPELFEED